RKTGAADGSSTSNWTLLPDYASRPERPLIDRLVRQGALSADLIRQLHPDEIPSQNEVEQWIARVFGFSTGAVAAPDAQAFATARYPMIRVLETTDFHGAILPGQRERGTNRQRGGAAALAAAIGRLRAENPEGTVLIDGGDLFQGTMISNLQFGRPVVEQMNALGYACTAIG